MSKLERTKIRDNKVKRLNQVTVWLLNQYHVKFFRYIEEIKESYETFHYEKPLLWPKLNVRELLVDTLFSESGGDFLIKGGAYRSQIDSLKLKYKKDYSRLKYKLLINKVKHFFNRK